MDEFVMCCGWLSQDGNRCESWKPRHREHCDYHHNKLLKAVEVYREIVAWCDKRYKVL